MKALYYIILFLFLSPVLFSQSIFKGRVVSETTNEALSAASIYFNNTSVGTSSNEKGQFSIGVPATINSELIISCVGFETLVYKIRPGEDLSQNYLFKLKKKENLLQEILILPNATRKKYLERFIENFLGVTQEGASSYIRNLDAIYFTRPEGIGFNAHSDTPLLIINKMLGYRVYFQLENFYYNEKNGSTSFYGYTRYEEMGNKNRWKKNRRKAYYGSSLHFFRSLINNTLEKESYQIFVVREDTIRSQNDRKIETAIPVTASQVVKKDNDDSSIYTCTWKHKLMVQYNKNPASRAYLMRNNRSTGELRYGVRSYLIINEPTVEIDATGILVDPLSLFFSGYWIYEKAANLLPYNYYPEPE